MKFFIKVVFVVLEFIIMQYYVMGECGNIKRISESSNNATGSGPFADGSAIEFTCNSGYKGVGSTFFYCRGSEWAGNFSCVRVCPQIKTPQNGLIVGNPEYVENTTIEFACLDRYTLVGSSSMSCSADGKWRPEAPPTCDPVSCGDFGSVPNGNVSQIKPVGVSNDFRSKLRITCNDGYNLIGSPIVTCKSDGTWSSRVWCKDSLCGTHPGSKSQCINDSSASRDGVVLSLLCHENYDNVSVTVVGTGIAVCIDNQWDNRDMGCFCDCLVDTDSKEGLTYHNLFNKKFVKHGDTLNWECDEGYKKQGLTNISCNDGQMENPQCVMAETRKEMTEGLPMIGIVMVMYCIIIMCYGVGIIINMGIRRCCTHRKQHDTKKTIDQTHMYHRHTSLDQSYNEPLINQQPLDHSNTEPLTIHTSLDRSYTEPLNIQSSVDRSYTGPLTIQSSLEQSYTEPLPIDSSLHQSDLIFIQGSGASRKRSSYRISEYKDLEIKNK